MSDEEEVYDVTDKQFFIVENGFQVMPPAHYKFVTVTDEQAITIGTCVYATNTWIKNALEQGKMTVRFEDEQ